MELNFPEAIIAGSISFNNCLFVRTVNFGRANFENGAAFMHSKFLKLVNFGKAQCRGSFAFYSVTFHKGVNFHSKHNDNVFSVVFADVKFFEMVPVFHG